MIKNITLSAEEGDIAGAREWAQESDTTLNSLFREWIKQCAIRNSKREAREREARALAFDEAMKRLSYVEAGRKFTREEMNDR